MILQDPILGAAWLAGLYEGEGTIWKNEPVRANDPQGRTQRSASLYIAIAMKDEDVIQHCIAVTGVGKVHVTHQYDYPMYHWRVRSPRDIEVVLKLIWPFLGERRRAQINKCLDWWNLYHEVHSDGKHIEKAIDRSELV